MRPENPSDRNFFRPQLKLYDPCTRINFSFSKILARYAEDEHFPLPIPRSLLSAAPCDIVIVHGGGRSLGPRSNFALPRVVQSVNGVSNIHFKIDRTTLGSAKFDLGPKLLPRP